MGTGHLPDPNLLHQPREAFYGATGNPGAQGELIAFPTGHNGALVIGRSLPTEFFEGTISEVRIWNTADCAFIIIRTTQAIRWD